MGKKHQLPVNKKEFKESKKQPLYLQQTNITDHMIQNAPTNFIINLYNKQPSTLLAKNDNPKDDNF